jgi:SpoVK/Ycf46/Vps4 family AAA+-type ATPase
MARADLLFDIIKYGLNNDITNLRRAAEAISAEERAKQHTILSQKIDDLLNSPIRQVNRDLAPSLSRNSISETSLFFEVKPKKRIEDLVLPINVVKYCSEIIEEQLRVDLLRSYGIEPRNRILLVGEPGNGKTSLAEAIAEGLSLPLLVVRYESIIGSYLGETANRLSKLFDYVRTRQCVLFFDEFETLGKERGDNHETGEIKRVVSSLLLYIDSLPSYVVVIAATNHDSLLDKAAWRRFQIKVDLPKPSRRNLEIWFSHFETKRQFRFGLQPSTLAKKLLGLSFAEVEEIAETIYRKYILNMSETSVKDISEEVLSMWETQVRPKIVFEGDQDLCQKDQ